jgi:hypothetical protein
VSKLILLKGPEGTRTIVEGETFRFMPGEFVVGPVGDDPTEGEINQELAKEGMGLGDLVAKAIHSTKLDVLFGKTHCTTCERRRQILNLARAQGVMETLKQLKETL